MLTFTAVLKKTAGSAFILIPKSIREKENLEIGDEVEFTIGSKLPQEATDTVKCLACEYIYEIENDVPECPVCHNLTFERIFGDST